MGNYPTTELYFEAHVTIEPVEDHVLRSRLIDLGNSLGFRMANFLMKKENTTPDDFFTCRDASYEMIELRTLTMVKWIEQWGGTVKRYKIENTLLDVKLEKA